MTEGRSREHDLGFQVDLEEQLSQQNSSAAIVADACRGLAQHLGVATCGYAEVDPSREALVLVGNWPGDPLHNTSDASLPQELLDRPLRLPIAESGSALATVMRQLQPGIELAAFLSVPFADDSELRHAVVYAVSPTPREWRAADEALLRAVGRMLRRGVRRVRENASLRASIGRLNGALRAATALGTWDWNIKTDLVQADEAFARLYSIDPLRAANGAPIGEFVTAIHPQDRPRVEREIQEAVDTAGPFESEYRLQQVDGSVSWVLARGRAYRDESGRPDRFPGVVVDITARRRTDAHKQFLNDLTLRWQDMDDPTEVAYAATEMLGHFFGVSRAGYGIVDLANETITIERDWNAPQVPSIAGVLKFREHGSYIDDLKRGDTVVVSNAETDSRTKDTAAVLKAINAHSFVNMPVVEKAGFVALLFLNHSQPRVFSADDVALLKEVAERTRIREERLRVAKALRDSEAQFRAVAEAMPGFLWAANSVGELTYTSPSWQEYCGEDGDGSLGHGWSAFVHPEDRTLALKRWQHSVTVGVLYETEFRLKRRDGVYRWWLVRAVPVRGKGDVPERWIGSAADIDALVEAREYLKQSRNDLERLVQERTVERDRAWHLSANLLVVTDPTGMILSVNTAWLQLLGWSSHELEGRLLTTFMQADPRNPSSVVPSILECTKEPLESAMRHRDGSLRLVEWTGAIENNRLYANGRDITHEREQETALAQAESTLRQAQKMEAVGQLTGGIAHDFNNMLSVIVGALDLLRRRLDTSDARTRRYVGTAMDGAKRAAVLTQRLLAFSRQQPLQPEAIDANALVSGMSDLLRHSLGVDIQFETVLAGGLWTLHADPNQLENVLVNLVVNARDAMPRGGKLTIETQNAHLDDRYVANELGVASGHYVLIAVTDTGSGMPAEIIAKAFDPFFTTKAVGKGTGLGLSQVYGFVKQSNGHVKIYSEVGVGTTVKIYLPRLVGTAADAESGERDSDMPRGDALETILVVEDESVVRQITTDSLAELGYRVLEADGAAGALRILDAHPEIQLLFTDIVMPEVNGAQLAAEARRRRPALKVLFTTGYTRNAVVHNGVLDAGVELISKPFTIDELAMKIRTTLDSDD